MYPLPLPTNWQTLDHADFSAIEKRTKDWIQCESSLTVRIKELGIAFNVEVLNQCHQPISDALKSKLATQDNQALFREVLLKQGDVPLIYAQTIMPESTITGTEKMLSELGNQSLGQVLFQSPQAIRSGLEFSEVVKQTELALFIEQRLEQTMLEPCYIRRSLFHLNHKPLLVCECFLPSLFN